MIYNKKIERVIKNYLKNRINKNNGNNNLAWIFFQFISYEFRIN